MNFKKFKIFFITILTKLGFISEHDFNNYKSRRNRLIKIFIISLIIVSIIAFIVGSLLTTSFLRTQNSDLKSDKNELSNQVKNLTLKLEQLRGTVLEQNLSILKKDTEINKLEAQNNLLNNEKMELSKRLDDEHNSLLSEQKARVAAINQFETELSNERIKNSELNNDIERLSVLFRNSVRTVCCSFSDIQQALYRNWLISGNNVICTTNGSYTVNCGTGTTDYEFKGSYN